LHSPLRRREQLGTDGAELYNLMKGRRGWPGTACVAVIAAVAGAFALDVRENPVLSRTTEIAVVSAGGDKLVSLEELKARYKRPEAIPFPKNNPHTVEKERLGRKLFFDPRLSRSQIVSCATCHNPSLGWSDGLPKGVGHEMQQLARRSPSVLNLAWAPLLMWDGRAHSLEHQASLPITAPEEMNMTMDDVVERLKSIEGYRDLFTQAFGETDAISEDNVLAALATYERTLVSGKAPFDRWIEGDETAISESAKNGFVLFNSKARCSACHAGWRFTDDSFHNIGLPTEDVGRGKFTPPSVAIMQYAFKTPALRDLRLQGPYMHDGSMKTLDQVLEHYIKGGEKTPHLSPEMRPVDLTANEKKDLIAFLETLRGPPVTAKLPELP